MKNRINTKLASILVAGMLATSAVSAQEGATSQDEALATLVEQGEQLFIDYCAVCHGDNGEGGAGPALLKNAKVESRSALVFQILFGATDHGMPPFASVLTDEEIAAIATYVRNSWDNEYGIVLARSVEMRRPAQPESEGEAEATTN